VLLSNGTGTGQVKLASGYVAMTWADIGSPTTVVNLSGTTIKTATDVETDTADIQARIPAALISGRIDATVGAMQTDVITATALASSAVTEIQSGLATAANLLIINDGIGFITAVLMGACSDAGTSAETYVITFNSATYTVDYTGLDSTGNRSTTTRTKT
jgi:hypothetical protein